MASFCWAQPREPNREGGGFGNRLGGPSPPELQWILGSVQELTSMVLPQAALYTVTIPNIDSIPFLRTVTPCRHSGCHSLLSLFRADLLVLRTEPLLLLHAQGIVIQNMDCGLVDEEYWGLRGIVEVVEG